MALICGHRLPLKLLDSTAVRTTGTSKTLEAFENATVQLMMGCRSKLEVPKSICGWWSINATTQLSGVSYRPVNLSEHLPAFRRIQSAGEHAEIGALLIFHRS
jgi:hypothetical protein